MLYIIGVCCNGNCFLNRGGKNKQKRNVKENEKYNERNNIHHFQMFMVNFGRLDRINNNDWAWNECIHIAYDKMNTEV